MTNEKTNSPVVEFNGEIKKINDDKLSYDAIREMIASRKVATELSKEDFESKRKSGEIVCLNGDGASSPVYLYQLTDIDQEMYRFAFYDKDGQLMFTFPWNGDLDSRIYCPLIESMPALYWESVKNIKFGATEDGWVAVTMEMTGWIEYNYPLEGEVYSEIINPTGTEFASFTDNVTSSEFYPYTNEDWIYSIHTKKAEILLEENEKN